MSTLEIYRQWAEDRKRLTNFNASSSSKRHALNVVDIKNVFEVNCNPPILLVIEDGSIGEEITIQLKAVSEIALTLPRKIEADANT